MLDVALSNQAQRFLDKAEHMLAARIAKKIEELRTDLFSCGAERVKSFSEKTFKVRVGDYRILYELFLERNLIGISKIDHRSRVYD